ncbi:Remorin family protein [Quillaja saponaria]|uniref:Remorin family protein n=1 Tax=Quillaja saponaria TaxID=32244 RepID=A0AAD7KT39_QUISA|nr:Remorin family protein [Quillaja saponaria]
MRSVEDKGCYNHGPSQKISNSSAITVEFHKENGVNRVSHHQTTLGKPTPSKWDDAQKWLVGLSRGGEKNQAKSKPRNSNADDLRLIAPVPQKEQDYSSMETKNVDCDESIWRVNKASENSISAVRSICVRDMGTEMTPIASQEPSRTATPIRATTPAVRSPISSGSSTPVGYQNGFQVSEGYQTGLTSAEENLAGRSNGTTRQCEHERNASKMTAGNNAIQARKLSPLESRAVAWDEAERAKYMARSSRLERIIKYVNLLLVASATFVSVMQSDTEIHTMYVLPRDRHCLKGVKAERMKTRAQEKLANKLAASRRIAEEKRASAEAKLNEKSLKTTEKADYIKRTGRVPSSFSFKLPSLCW